MGRFRCQQVRHSSTLAKGRNKYGSGVRGVWKGRRGGGEVVAVSPNKQAKSAQKCWQTVSISISGEKLMATFLSTFQFIFARFFPNLADDARPQLPLPLHPFLMNCLQQLKICC